jgi:hypothetical protein
MTICDAIQSGKDCKLNEFTVYHPDSPKLFKLEYRHGVWSNELLDIVRDHIMVPSV